MPRPLKILSAGEQLSILNRLFRQADCSNQPLPKPRAKRLKGHLLAAIRELQEEQAK